MLPHALSKYKVISEIPPTSKDFICDLKSNKTLLRLSITRVVRSSKPN